MKDTLINLLQKLFGETLKEIVWMIPGWRAAGISEKKTDGLCKILEEFKNSTEYLIIKEICGKIFTWVLWESFGIIPNRNF